MITSCISAVGKSIAPNCAHPIVGGYTGRAVLIPVGDPTAVITQNEANPRIVEAISKASGAEALNVIGIENYYLAPFENSSKASNGDNGSIAYNKTVSFHIPLRGAGNSKDIVEPLSKSARGFIAVLEKKDKVGDGSFEVVGLLQGLTCNADGVSQDEATSNGDVVITMSCVESWYECTFFDTDYATTLAAFDVLYEASI